MCRVIQPKVKKGSLKRIQEVVSSKPDRGGMAVFMQTVKTIDNLHKTKSIRDMRSLVYWFLSFLEPKRGVRSLDWRHHLDFSSPFVNRS